MTTAKTFRAKLFLGLAFNAVAVVTGGMGSLTPVMAAIVHNVGSVLVVLGSASPAILPIPFPPINGLLIKNYLILAI